MVSRREIPIENAANQRRSNTSPELGLTEGALLDLAQQILPLGKPHEQPTTMRMPTTHIVNSEVYRMAEELQPQASLAASQSMNNEFDFDARKRLG